MCELIRCCVSVNKDNLCHKNDTGGYFLRNGQKVSYNLDKEHWEDESGNPCRAVMIGRELAGFSFRAPIDDIDREIYNLTGEGRAYLQYNEVIGGDPFGFTVGMPVEADPELYGGIAGMYQECIRREITWEELLQWDGHSDELDIC